MLSLEHMERFGTLKHTAHGSEAVRRRIHAQRKSRRHKTKSQNSKASFLRLSTVQRPANVFIDLVKERMLTLSDPRFVRTCGYHNSGETWGLPRGIQNITVMGCGL